MWSCKCEIMNLPVQHETGTFCGRCGTCAPGFTMPDVRDVELASLRGSYKTLKAKHDELLNYLKKIGCKSGAQVYLDKLTDDEKRQLADMFNGGHGDFLPIKPRRLVEA